MPLFLIPLVSFLSAMFLLNLGNRTTSYHISRYLSFFSGLLSLVIIATVKFTCLIPVEYPFSPLFILPGMSETLSFSLYVDDLALEWLFMMSLASFFIYILALKDNSPETINHLAALHLTQSGLAIFFLSGSPISGIIGLGITLAAILLAVNFSTSHSIAISNFTVLMFPVFLLLTASFLLYGVTGKLSYSNNPESMALLLKTLIGFPANPLVVEVLSFVSLALFFAVLPGLGLIPFSSWLADTREMHSLGALFVYVNVMPAGLLLLQRFSWLFQFTPFIRYLAFAISIISILMAYTAVFSQKGIRLTMLWLAITCSGLLLGVLFATNSENLSLLLKILYPGLFVFGFGRVIEFEYHQKSGKLFQIAGILLPWLIGASIPIFTHQHLKFYLILTGIPIVLYSIPAVRIFQSSASESTDTVAFSSSLGWSAYRFFGTRSVLYYAFTWPIQQLADGFLILESGLSFFLTHGLARLIRSWSRLLWLFDKWFIDGSCHWLKFLSTSQLPKRSKEEYIALILVGIGAVSLIFRDLVLWI